MAAFFPRSNSTALEFQEISEELFQRMSVRAGVWDDAEAAEHYAKELRDRSRSPSPESDDNGVWMCPECHSCNSPHVLYCEMATCGSRRAPANGAIGSTAPRTIGHALSATT